MVDIQLEYNLLDQRAKMEVLNFMDFLLSKKPSFKKKPISEYKKKILNVSTWTDADSGSILKFKVINQCKSEKWHRLFYAYIKSQSHKIIKSLSQ